MLYYAQCCMTQCIKLCKRVICTIKITLTVYFPRQNIGIVYKSLVTKLEGSLDYSLSAFAEEFDVDEMGRITKLLNLTKEIPITEETLSEYIEVIRSDFDKSKREQSGEIDLAAIARRKRKE